MPSPRGSEPAQSTRLPGGSRPPRFTAIIWPLPNSLRARGGTARAWQGSFGTRAPRGVNARLRSAPATFG
eukprot:3363081-Pleurochrysis_carterae.AAC.1